MALITKATVASVLGISDSDLPQSVYDWAVTQFYAITDLVATDTEKTKTEYIATDRSFIQLGDINIKTIDALILDGVDTDFTLNEDLKFNPETGLVIYGFGGGQLVKIEYTVSAFTALPIHDYLISLLATKALSIFTPGKLGQVKMVKIGKYQRQFANVADDLEDYMKSLNDEIMNVVGLINGDDGRMKFGALV